MRTWLRYAPGIFLPVLISCTESDINPKEKTEGEWTLQEISYKMQYEGEDAEEGSVDYSSFQYAFSLNADGTFTSTISDEVLDSEGLLPGSTGTYKIEDGKLTFTFEEDGYQLTTSYYVTVSGDVMTLKMDRALYLEVVETQFKASEEIFAFLGITLEELMAEVKAAVKIIDIEVKLNRAG